MTESVLTPNLLNTDADACLEAYNGQGDTEAGCSLWWRNTPLLNGAKTGYIGAYQCKDETAGTEVLKQAVSELAKHDCRIAIGPIDGNTWRPYRFVVQSSEEPAFPMEPTNDPSWPGQFQSSGFEVIASYSSYLCTQLNQAQPGCRELAAQLRDQGVTIRTFNMADSTNELNRLFTLSVKSFAGNFLYSSISRPEFISRYQPLLPILDPELVLIAQKEGTPVGFVLAMPNVLAHAPDKTVIVKTLARLPHKELAGLGRVLLQECHQRAWVLGYRRAIHALMKDDNASLGISESCAGTPFRKYALFSRRIDK